MPKAVVHLSAFCAALGCFVTGLFPFFNADGFGHLAQGREIAELGSVPRVDRFSFWKPEPQRWTNYEWLYDVGTWSIYETFGATGLVLVKCAALGALGYALVLIGYRLAGRVTVAAPLALSAILLALPVARLRFTVRPQIVGLLFPAVLLLGVSVLYTERRGTRSKLAVLVGLGALHLVWVNAHGSHLLGLLITLIFLAVAWGTQAFRWMAALLGVELLAMGLTPFGFSIVSDALAHLVQPEFRDALVEWSAWTPNDPMQLLVAPTIAAILVLVALRPVTRTGRFGLGYAVFCAVLCAMAFRSTRFVAHQLLYSAPFIAAGIALLPRVASLRAGLVPVVLGAVVVSGFWMSQLRPQLGFGVGESRSEYPWGSAEVIAASIDSPRILATMQDSWALLFAVPEARVLIDGRVPFYGPAFVKEIAAAFTNPNAFVGVLTEFDVNTVAIDHTRGDHLPATEVLARHPSWRLVFVEDGHSLFVRNDAAEELAGLEFVGPGYRTGKVLDPGVADEALDEELRRLEAASTDGTSIRAWLRGLQRLRPLVRQADEAGIRPSADEPEAALAREAAALLAAPSTAYPGFASIELYRAMAALSACDVEQAREAHARSRVTGETRDTVLVGIEIGLRAGSYEEQAAASEHLARLQSQPETAEDPWVVALSQEAVVRCAPPVGASSP